MYRLFRAAMFLTQMTIHSIMGKELVLPVWLMEYFIEIKRNQLLQPAKLWLNLTNNAEEKESVTKMHTGQLHVQEHPQLGKHESRINQTKHLSPWISPISFPTHLHVALIVHQYQHPLLKRTFGLTVLLAQRELPSKSLSKHPPEHHFCQG